MKIKETHIRVLEEPINSRHIQKVLVKVHILENGVIIMEKPSPNGYELSGITKEQFYNMGSLI